MSTLPIRRAPGTPPRYSRPSRLRDLLLACLAESPLPISTVDLYLLCACGQTNGRVRVWQVLTTLEQRGRVRRVDPLPTAAEIGKPPFRWVLVEAERGAA